MARMFCTLREMDSVCVCVVCVRMCSVCVWVSVTFRLCKYYKADLSVALVKVTWVRQAVKHCSFSVNVFLLSDHTSIHGNLCTRRISTPTRTALTTLRSTSAPPATTTPVRRSSPSWRYGLSAFSSSYDSGLKLSSLSKAKAKMWIKLPILCHYFYVG